MRLASARSYALLSVAAALITIALKTLAWSITGSVGLLSDALESSVNLVAALTAFWALGKPPNPLIETTALAIPRRSTSPAAWRAP